MTKFDPITKNGVGVKASNDQGTRTAGVYTSGSTHTIFVEGKGPKDTFGSGKFTTNNKGRFSGNVSIGFQW